MWKYLNCFCFEKKSSSDSSAIHRKRSDCRIVGLSHLCSSGAITTETHDTHSFCGSPSASEFQFHHSQRSSWKNSFFQKLKRKRGKNKSNCEVCQNAVSVAVGLCFKIDVFGCYSGWVCFFRFAIFIDFGRLWRSRQPQSSPKGPNFGQKHTSSHFSNFSHLLSAADRNYEWFGESLAVQNTVNFAVERVTYRTQQLY